MHYRQSDVRIEMAHPNENFHFNLSLEHAGASSSGGQHNEVDLFVEWSTDRPENFGNAIHQGVYVPLDQNVFAG
ncbi:hypothetical protein PVK06_007908 [Gossypium arboreum]|uniref:Uncharacterized protein n=1 Tax=Gossypium arboreum TaxID=29729 RepID=A0ABR0QIR8_GOSAR|nr:hypothetical protein PVK06_007908 [Gossypium arboreum]